jgi:hypothetical protein
MIVTTFHVLDGESDNLAEQKKAESLWKHKNLFKFDLN